MAICKYCNQEIPQIARSISQNNYYFLCCRSIAAQVNEQGNQFSYEDIHALHHKKFPILRKELVAKLNGREFVETVDISTARLSKQDFMEFITQIGAFWAEFGVTLPNIEYYEQTGNKKT